MEQRNYTDIEADIKATLNAQGENQHTERKELKPLLLELKARGQDTSIQFLMNLVDTCNSDVARRMKVRRALKREGLTWHNVETSKQVQAWRKWNGEIKDYHREKDGTISLLTMPQGFGHECREIETKTFQIVNL